MFHGAMKVDENHREMVQFLENFGANVRSLHTCGDGIPDLLVGWAGVLILVEVKNPNQIPSKRKLTPLEEEFFAAWADFPVFKVETVTEMAEVLNKVNRKARGKQVAG